MFALHFVKHSHSLSIVNVIKEKEELSIKLSLGYKIFYHLCEKEQNYFMLHFSQKDITKSNKLTRNIEFYIYMLSIQMAIISMREAELHIVLSLCF